MTQTLDQSTWQRREQRRLQLKPQPQRRRLLSQQAWICSSQILLACFFKFCICSSQHFSYTMLWMQPSGLSHLRLFSTETGVRYFVKSFVLCAEGHRHPQQGWVAARADYWPLKANKAYVRKKWFIILWIAREIMKPSSKCEPELFPLLSNTPPAIWAEQIFIPEIVFFSLVRISALKFSGLRAHFSSAVAGWTLRSQLDNPGMKYVARIPWLLMKAKKA